MNKYLSCMLLGTTLSVTQTVLANPASTEYVNQRVNEAINSLTTNLGSEINKLVNQMNSQRIPFHQVGEHYQGGIIFFVDESRHHGLIAALHDANNEEGMQWQNGDSGEKIVNARANGMRAGESNTRLIISQQTIDYQEGNFAALAASNYSVLADGNSPCAFLVNSSMICYGDWYLPSIYELTLLQHAFLSLGLDDLKQGSYWSSSEHDTTQAWLFDGETSTPQLSNKSTHARVRAIHAF